MTTIDVEALKASADLVTLAGRHTQLANWASHEKAGPCPKCSGTDRFHVHDDGWWKCYQCHPKPGDAIEFAMWLNGLDFRAACQWLGADVDNAPAAPRQPAQKPKEQAWKTSEWQQQAHCELQEAIARLQSPEGEPGRAYLTQRALEPATWRACSIGYADAWHPFLKEPRPAIVIPWQAKGTIKALQYRFFWDGITKHERFGAKKGSERTLFGIDLLGAHFQTLFLVEGELNALSIWQALRGAYFVNWDVVSYGGEGGASSPKVVELAKRYAQVIIWADSDRDPEATAKAMRAIPGAFGLKSPQQNGVKLDANALLQAGMLAEFMRAAWRRFDQAQALAAQAMVERDV